jgi:hypothetical protein
VGVSVMVKDLFALTRSKGEEEEVEEEVRTACCV